MRVGLCYPNSISYVVLTFALWRLQAVVVPIPTECSEEEVATIIEAMHLEAVLNRLPAGARCPQPSSRVEPMKHPLTRPSATLSPTGGEGRVRGQRATERIIGSEPVSPEVFLTWLAQNTKPDNHGLNIAFIRFTSGTTSSQKGVVLCHETVRDRVLAANKLLQIGPDDTVAWCLPMAHHFLVTIVLYLSRGATVALMRNTLAQTFLETVNRSKATVLYASPFHYALLARDRTGVQMPSVRLAVSTTCALPADVAEDFFARFRIPLAQALGVIELGLVSLNRKPTPENWGSVGQPGEDFRVKIVAPDDQGCGEVAVAGPGLFDAYAAPWRSRDEVLRDGWFFTGDIGRMDADGFLYLVSRKTAVINLAGRKVFPEEIEAVLNRHPAVRESRVYGRPHAHLGEVVEAEVVMKTPEADLESVRAFCRDHLAAFKVPTQLRVVNALPRTAVTGKIRRAAAVAHNG